MPYTVAAQVHEAGAPHVPANTVRWFVEGQLSVEGSRVRVASGAAQLFMA